MRKNGETPILTTNFAVHRSADANYSVRMLPRLGALRRTGEGGQPNIKVPRADMEQTLVMFQEDAGKVGLEVGKHDPAVKILRVKGVGFGESAKNPEMHPGSALMQINDGSGNAVRFRLAVEPQILDGQDREWDRIIARIEYAVIGGKEIPLTHEMTHGGFIFLTHGMQDALQQVKDGQQPTITIRQETPDAACFTDGHHASAGRKDLGCYCKEEREASLAIIHQRGGINSLMPGTGNGNGSEAQDIQLAVNASRARRGMDTLAYPEMYNRMGMEGDKRNSTLNISTLLLEHLFQVKNIPNITTLTESRTKQNVWHEFGGVHTVMGESLNVTPIDHPDSKYKQQAFGYTRADQSPFPLQPR